MEKENNRLCCSHQRRRHYTLSDLIEIVDEVHATVRALPEEASLSGIRKQFVLERLDLMLRQLWYYCEDFD